MTRGKCDKCGRISERTLAVQERDRGKAVVYGAAVVNWCASCRAANPGKWKVVTETKPPEDDE